MEVEINVIFYNVNNILNYRNSSDKSLKADSAIIDNKQFILVDNANDEFLILILFDKFKIENIEKIKIINTALKISKSLEIKNFDIVQLLRIILNEVLLKINKS